MTSPAKAILLSERERTLSIATIARELGISRSGLSRRLDGKLRWKRGEAEVVARLLGVPLEYVIGARFPSGVIVIGGERSIEDVTEKGGKE